jgi:hypothetical protein
MMVDSPENELYSGSFFFVSVKDASACSKRAHKSWPPHGAHDTNTLPSPS